MSVCFKARRSPDDERRKAFGGEGRGREIPSGSVKARLKWNPVVGKKQPLRQTKASDVGGAADRIYLLGLLTLG